MSFDDGGQLGGDVQERIAVVTDDACGLDGATLTAQIESGSLTILDLTVTVGDRELNTVSSDDLEVALAAGEPVQTSRPSPGAVERCYRDLAERGFTQIVSIHLSGRISGTVDSARWAAGRSPVPVYVIDSGTAGYALGYAVRDACRLAAAGSPVAEVVAAARDACERYRVRFFVPSLEQLRRGGRVGPIAAWWGDVLAIKPLLQLDGGAVVPFEQVRTTNRAVRRLGDLAIDQLQQLRSTGTSAEAAIHHFGNESDAEALRDRIAEATGVIAQLSRLPPVLAAHVGLGVLGTVTGAASPSPGR